MSKNDIYREERARRVKSISDLTNGNIDIRAAIEQFNKLDEAYKKEEQTYREELECVYKETRHYNGQWPIVYSLSQTSRYPYFNGDSDDDCNAYYRISHVIAGTADGISPEYSAPTRTGGSAVNRYRSYTSENTLRSTARAALVAYPDRTNEDTPTGGSCSDPQYTDESTCTLNGEFWDSGYGNDTAVDLLTNAINAWKSSITQLKADLCNATASETQELQDIIDEIDNCISLLPPIPIYPDQTPDPEYVCTNPFYDNQVACEFNGETWYSPLQDSIDAIINYIDNEMVNTFDARKTDLNGKSNLLEQKFFAVIGLRIHQINGSYSKLKQVKEQLKDNLNLIADHQKSIANINVLITKDTG